MLTIEFKNEKGETKSYGNNGIQKLGYYVDKYDNVIFGWIEPIQLWLPFEHLDFTWNNLKRSNKVLFIGKC